MTIEWLERHARWKVVKLLPIFGRVKPTDRAHSQAILALRTERQDASHRQWCPGVRVRTLRQLGYKMANCIKRFELVEHFASIGGGNGGCGADQGYSWYAGS